MHEFTDLLNVGSIACETLGFVILLPRIKDWIRLKTVYRSEHRNNAWYFLQNFMKKDLNYCKEYLKILQYSLEEDTYKKFISTFERVHYLANRINADALKENLEYKDKRSYLLDVLSDDSGNRRFRRRYHSIENIAIPLVIIGLIGQGISVFLHDFSF